MFVLVFFYGKYFEAQCYQARTFVMCFFSLRLSFLPHWMTPVLNGKEMANVDIVFFMANNRKSEKRRIPDEPFPLPAGMEPWESMTDQWFVSFGAFQYSWVNSKAPQDAVPGVQHPGCEPVQRPGAQSTISTHP